MLSENSGDESTTANVVSEERSEPREPRASRAFYTNKDPNLNATK